MEKLLLINPSKPPRKRRNKKRVVKRAQPKATKRSNPMAKTRRKRRTAAQRAATRKLVAMNRRRAPGRRRRRNPIARRRRRAVGYTVGKAPIRRRKVNPIRRRSVRRRNPIRRGLLDRMVFPALTATGGALALDIAWAYLPLPAQLKVGPVKHLAKAAGAVGLSYVAGMVVSKRTAEQMGMGALTVVTYNVAREFLATSAPQLRMDGIGYMNPAFIANASPGRAAMGYYPRQGMGYYPPQASTRAPMESEANYQY